MRCRYSTVFEPIASPFLHNERFWEVGKGVICTVTEALKGEPYRLCWQKLLGCELLANEAGCLSIRAQVTHITHFKQGTYRASTLRNQCCLFSQDLAIILVLQYQQG
jgi:hypothetical protein